MLSEYSLFACAAFLEGLAKRVASELFASCPLSRLAEEDRSGILFTCDYSLFGLVFHVKGKYSIVSFDYS